MPVISLFDGILFDGRPCSVWSDDEMLFMLIGDTTLSLPKDMWSDLVTVLSFSARKQDALEEGNLTELEQVNRDIKEREDFIQDNECDCDDV